MAGTNIGYSVFITADEKFTNVLLGALKKSHVPGPRVGKFNGKLMKCHATASPVLRCLH